MATIFNLRAISNQLESDWGQLMQVPVTATINLTEAVGPGLRNNFTLVNAYTWEGGRGYRCDFWRSMAALVPEKTFRTLEEERSVVRVLLKL
jgi:hypothetical protein